MIKGKQFDPNSDPERIRAEAADWISKMDRGLSRSETLAFEAWRSQSEVHQHALKEQEWNWSELDRLAGLHTRYGSREDPNLLIEDRSKRVHSNPLLRWVTLCAVAASFVVSIAALIRLVPGDEEPKVLVPAEVIVERIQNESLDDGSNIQLNRGTTVEVDYSDTKRLVHLKKGEASFDVAKDPQRPFFVMVGGVEVQAIGTAFNVRLLGDEVDVIVTEGTVSMRQARQASQLPDQADEVPEPETILNANNRARVNLSDGAFAPRVEAIEEQRVAEELIWKPVLIDFEDVPLSKIISEFNRRNPVQMVIVDESVNKARLSSMFWSDNINGLIRLLESNFGVQATWGEDNTIYLFSSAP